jgi:hypothetical protein
LRPWIEGKHLYESLLDGKLGLEDIALMNDALDIRDENTRRMNERAAADAAAASRR